MEKDVEAKLREKFALIDKSDVEQLAEAQKVISFKIYNIHLVILKSNLIQAGLTIADDSSYAGESDGQSFGIGLAPKESRMSKNELLKVSKSKRTKGASKTRYIIFLIN
jgi:hypothetical protein